MRRLALSLMVASSVALAGEGRIPVVIELFTSEGCSSCPQADALLAALESEQPVPGVEVIPLGLHVTYWDRLGWPDPYGNPAFADRQERYADAIGGGTYTPEMVVDGSVGFPGGRDRTLNAVRKAAEQAGKSPMAIRVVKVEKDAVEVEVKLPESARPADGELVVALTQGGLSTEVKRGENEGRTLKHAAVVRAFKVVVKPAAKVTVKLPREQSWDVKSLKVVAFSQSPGPGRIVAAGQVSVAREG